MKEDREILTDDELDAIGEILNISMGAAATAVSTMLERQVMITTPQIIQDQLQNVDFSDLEPAIIVKINYIEGLSGTNVIMIRRKDMGVILNLLMDNDTINSDDFEFDDMSMSAACEVMNQMMGSSATAMSEMINKPINISTPQTMLVDHTTDTSKIFDKIDQAEQVVAISFKMAIKDALDTTFSCVLPLELSRAIIQSINGGMDDVEQSPNHPVAQSQNPAIQQTQEMPSQPSQSFQQPPQAPTQAIPQAPPRQDFWQPTMPNDPQYQSSAIKPPATYPYQQPYQQTVDPAYQYQQYQQPPLSQQPYGQASARQYPYGHYSQYQEPPQNTRYVMPSLNVKQVEFPDFPPKTGQTPAIYSTNMNMLLGVQLEVSVVIGRAKQKIKDVLDLGQGSVIELDRQTGSPAEIVVNGQLIAYGDVVVVGDNFGIRITEIIGTKELIDSIEKNNK